MGHSPIIVVGGGIGGLTAAIALLREGFPAEVHEAAPAWADIGAGVTLAPNAMLGFRHLGLDRAIAERGVEPSRQVVSHWQDGRTLLELDRGESTRLRYGVPYIYIHRADLHSILTAETLRLGGRIHLDSRVARVEPGLDEARVILADGRALSTPLAVGADGLKSVVRALHDPGKPHFTGHIAYRAVAPVTDQLAALAANPGMHIGPGRQVVRYPVRNGELLNIVLFSRQDGWTEEGWTIPASADELSSLFAGWCDDVQLMIGAASGDRIFKWAINARTPLASWSIGDHVTLLGDAAHAMTPFLGQGAATAIEDAVILARCLSSFQTRGEALRRYEAARLERTSFIQSESNANADRIQGPESELYGLGNIRNEESLGLFAYDCTSVEI